MRALWFTDFFFLHLNALRVQAEILMEGLRTEILFHDNLGDLFSSF